MASVNDSFQHLAIDLDHEQKMMMWKIQEKSVLIVVIDKNSNSELYIPQIEESLEIIEQGTSFS